jgi:galactokinase
MLGILPGGAWPPHPRPPVVRLCEVNTSGMPPHVDQVVHAVSPAHITLLGDYLPAVGASPLTFEVDRRATVKCRRRADNVVNVWWSAKEPGRTTFEAGRQAQEPWCQPVAQAFAGQTRGADVVIESDIWASVGLGSRAAVHRAVSHALGDAPQTNSPDPLPSWTDDGLILAIIATGVRHQIGPSQWAARAQECQQAADALAIDHLAAAGLDAAIRLDDPTLKARTAFVLTESARVRAAQTAIKRRNWQQLGQILDASQASLRDDFEVSCPELDEAADVAREAGALGARMLGKGFGGSVAALIAPEQVQGLRDRVESRFFARQWPRPSVVTVRASAKLER